eukprot:4601531-Ditylum_brightwellii.AAC.1
MVHDDIDGNSDNEASFNQRKGKDKLLKDSVETDPMLDGGAIEDDANVKANIILVDGMTEFIDSLSNNISMILAG